MIDVCFMFRWLSGELHAASAIDGHFVLPNMHLLYFVVTTLIYLDTVIHDLDL